MSQQTIFKINLESFVLYQGIYEFRKIRKTSAKASTNRAKNIFPKYFIYPEISEGEGGILQLLRQYIPFVNMSEQDTVLL